MAQNWKQTSSLTLDKTDKMVSKLEEKRSKTGKKVVSKLEEHGLKAGEKWFQSWKIGGCGPEKCEVMRKCVIIGG